MKEKSELPRQLGLFDASMVMVGIVIGSGIYLTTGIMARSLPSPGWILLAWLVGGLLTLAGAFSYAELGAMFPWAGGQYVYLREAFGSWCGFLFGWIMFLVYMSGGIAGLAVAFSEYFSIFVPGLSPGRVIFSQPIDLGVFTLPLALTWGQLLAISMIILFSGVNYIGLRFGKLIQNSVTSIKIGGLLVLIAAGLLASRGRSFSFNFAPSGLSFAELLVGFGVALVAVSWAFDGWNNVNFVAGEVKKPGRNLPRALILGTLLVMVLYLLVNAVYLLALPIGEMSGQVRVAEMTARKLFGTPAAALITVAVLISILGALNGSILVGPRVYYAMARDGLFFRRAARVHPRFRTPSGAIVIQAIWSSLLALSGSFEQLLTFVMFMAIVFWIGAVLALFVLRKKLPDRERPYRTWGYPWLPVIFILASLGILANTLTTHPVEALAGLGLTLLGVPVYWLWQRRNRETGAT